MPEPVSALSTDRAVYYITKRAAPYLCAVHPNVISVVGFLIVLPILYNIHYRRGVPELLVLAFVRQFFDCLDGTVARRCGTGSMLGAQLDIGLDLLTAVLVSVYVLYRLATAPPKETYKTVVLSGMILVIVFYLGKYMYDKLSSSSSEEIEEIKFDALFQFGHDNSVICVLLIFYIVKALLM